MNQALAAFSDALAVAVEAAGTSVVRVEARRRLPASGIVWSADGLIITAHHVVQHDDSIAIGQADGRTVAASLVGRDPTTDLALLRAKANDLIVPTWVNATEVRVGHLALALGRPGRNVMATLGIVSALKKDWRTPAGGQVDHYLQSDALMSPGFSGGPLIDAGGRFIGLNTSAVLRDVALVIPAATLSRVIHALLAHGHVKRGYLGVTAQTVRLPGALAERLDQETGLLLGAVEDNGPAARGGLFMGDTIIAIAGQPIRHLDDLLIVLSGDRIGQSASVRIIRGGQVIEVPVIVGEQD